MFLYHYYSRGCEPFRSLSDLPQARADAVLDELRRIEAGDSVNDELLDVIEMIADILGGMKEEFE